MKRTPYIIGISLMTVAALLSSCGHTAAKKSQKEIPYKSNVMAYIKDTCGEKCTIDDYETIYDLDKNIIYHVSSEERDLHFIVYQNTDESGKLKYQTDYMNCVRDLYSDEILAEFDKFQNSTMNGIYLRNTEELKDICQAVAKANKIYRKELKYNDEDFLKDNNFGTVSIKGESGSEDDHYPNALTTFTIDGTVKSVDDLLTETKNILAQKVKDGSLSYERYQGLDSELSSIHKSELNHIYLNDNELLYDNNTSEYTYYGLSTDEYCYSTYNPELDTYMMFIDYGLIADYCGSNPLIMREWANALGGSYKLLTTEQTERKLEIEAEWTVNNHTWQSSAKYDANLDNSGVQKFTVLKDGNPLDIKTYEKENNIHTLQVTAEDFCTLFDLTYTIDEANDAIYFYSN